MLLSCVLEARMCVSLTRTTQEEFADTQYLTGHGTGCECAVARLRSVGVWLRGRSCRLRWLRGSVALTSTCIEGWLVDDRLHHRRELPAARSRGCHLSVRRLARAAWEGWCSMRGCGGLPQGESGPVPQHRVGEATRSGLVSVFGYSLLVGPFGLSRLPPARLLGPVQGSLTLGCLGGASTGGYPSVPLSLLQPFPSVIPTFCGCQVPEEG